MSAAREDKPKKPALKGGFVEIKKDTGAMHVRWGSVLTVKIADRFSNYGKAAVKVTKVQVKELERQILGDMKRLAVTEEPVDLTKALAEDGVTVLKAETAIDLLDNPGKPNKKLAALLELH
ncbi:hypothetical protein [Metapseudomonas sp. CR1201]